MEPNQDDTASDAVNLDAGLVVEVLRQQLNDLMWQNTLLKAQLRQAQAESAAQL